MSQNLTIHSSVGCPFALGVIMTAHALDLNPKVKLYSNKADLKSVEFMRLHPQGMSGLVETDHGMLTDIQGSMKYFARLDTKKNLYGKTNFERAQIDMLLKECTSACMPFVMLRGMASASRSGTQKELLDGFNKAPMFLKGMEERLGKGTYLLGDSMTIADVALACLMWFNRGCTLPATVMKRLPNMSKWWDNMTTQSWWTRVLGKAFPINKPLSVPNADEVNAFLKESTVAAPKVAETKADAPLKGKAAVQAKMNAEKAKTEEKKSTKPAVIAKSSVVFDVKGYEVGYDFEKLAVRIRKEVNMDGLVWMNKHEVKPIAFGMNKLQMTMLIEDEKVQTDDVFELIEAWEDDVQSTDVVSFSKA